MSDKIFKNAYFGKAYRTRDGRKALYHSCDNIYLDNPYASHHNLILEKREEVRDTLWIWANDFGHIEEHINGEWLEETDTDIISEWQEPIDEDKLDKLVDNCIPYHYDCDCNYADCFDEGFRAGYRAAKSE